MTTQLQSFAAWVKQPSSMLSVLSVLVSIMTFYMVNCSGGRIHVELPEEVGFGITPPSLLVPAVFYSTGTPRRESVVKHITSILTVGDKSGERFSFEWVTTQQFIGGREYEKKYPEDFAQGPKPSRFRDWVTYESRAYPFILFGGNAITKLLQLDPVGPSYNGPQLPQNIYVSLITETTSGRVETGGIYILKRLDLRGGYSWYGRQHK